MSMRLVPCAGPGCAERRIHWERPDTPRGVQMVPVMDDYKGEKAYCSLTCAIMDGAIRLCCEGKRDDPHQEHCKRGKG